MICRFFILGIGLPTKDGDTRPFKKEQELDLIHEKQKLNVIIFVVVILARALVVLVITNRRKNQRYRQIVRQQHELIRKEQVIEKLYGKTDGSGKYASSLSDEKGQALFSEFERLMKTGKIYREPDITIDKAAETATAV